MQAERYSNPQTIKCEGNISNFVGKQEKKLNYKGFFKHTNEKPTGEYIEIFVSDWNKEHWSFYVYISQDNYEEDIEEINNLITELNYRDQDYYFELIDRSDELKGFYNYIYDSNRYTHSDILNIELWEILEEKGDNHFLYFSKLNGSSEIDELRDAEFMTFQDWDEVLEMCHPDLYKTLDESHALCCFDIEHFYNCSNLYKIDGCIVEEIN